MTGFVILILFPPDLSFLSQPRLIFNTWGSRFESDEKLCIIKTSQELIPRCQCSLSSISGWIFQKVLAEIVQKDLILSQKALISNRRNLGLFAPTSMRFPSKDSKSKDLSF